MYHSQEGRFPEVSFERPGMVLRPTALGNAGQMILELTGTLPAALVWLH